MSQCTGFTKMGLRCKRRGHCHQHGQNGFGLLSDAKDAIKRRVNAIKEGPRLRASKRFQDFLESKKGIPVVKLELGQKPIISNIRKLADLVSGGRFSKKAKELNYSSIYHNFLIVTLADGTQWKIEKNAFPEHKPLTRADLNAKRYDVPVTKELTLDKMVETASRGNEERFWKYRADSDNCQRFTRDMIEKNGLLPEDTRPHALQDAKALVNEVPAGSTIANAVTDTAAVVDRVIHGDGLY